MRLKLASILLTSALASCAAPVAPDNRVPPDLEVRVVTAHEARSGSGPIGVTDRFSLDDKVVAFVTLSWPENHAAIGERAFESRWYSGDRLVRKATTAFTVARSPFMFWREVRAASLGPGPARYEIHVDGRKVAEHAFEVIDGAKQIDRKPTRLESI